MDDKGHPIIITGHPYAFPHYFKVFEYVENKDDFVFILPKVWKAKGGKINIKLEKKPWFLIFGARAASYGGKGLGGLLKGWLPAVVVLLPYMRFKYGSRVLYSCSEPNLLTTLFNGITAKFWGLKYVIFTWQNVLPEKRMKGLKLRLSNAFVGLNLRLADGVICGNKKAEQIIKRLAISDWPASSKLQRGERLETIVCPLSGVDVDKFRPGITSDWREKLGVKPEEKLILFYGALDKRKGLNVLIDALSLLYAIRYTLNAKLVIVGTGPELKNLKLQTTNYKLQTKIVFLDWMPNDQLPALLNTADVFVYPSVPLGGWEEQFGYAMAEASACGVPVVATRTGSIDEVVQDPVKLPNGNNGASGRSGLLVEPNNPEQLAEAIAKILSDEEFAREMGEFGRKYIVENFSHQVIVGKISDFLYEYI